MLTRSTPSVAPSLSIVQVSSDRELSRLRARVLTAAGHAVRSIDLEELAAECESQGAARVWVFCHTVGVYKLAPIAVTIRRARPADKLLRMTGLEDTGEVAGLFDGFLDPAASVDDMLRAISKLADS